MSTQTPHSPSADAALAVLADRAELTDLVSRLGRWLDDGGQGDPAALFVEDVRVSTPGGEAQGFERLVAQAQRNHTVPTQHLITNVLVDVEDGGTRAAIGANLVVTFVDAPDALRRQGQTYAFEARRTGAGWRLSSVVVRPVWQEG